MEKATRIKFIKGSTRFIILDEDRYKMIENYNIYETCGKITISVDGKRKILKEYLFKDLLNNNTDVIGLKENMYDYRFENIYVYKFTERKSKYKNKSSKYIGVSFCTTRQYFQARCTINKKVTHLGYFENETSAALCYNDFCIKNGLDRNLNKIEYNRYPQISMSL